MAGIKETKEVLAFVFSTALFTSPNTGLSKCLSPAFPGVTPPTKFVPYSMACSQCNVAWEPVKPWQMAIVSFPIKILILKTPQPFLLQWIDLVQI